VRSPYSPFQLIAFIAVLIVLLTVVQIGVISIAFDKLGLSPTTVYLLLFASLFGSAINLPLFLVDAESPEAPPPIPPLLRGLLRVPERPYEGKTLVAVNVGGCIIPVLFSISLLNHHSIPWLTVIAGIAIVATVSRFASRPVSGLGIGIPIFVAPLTAAVVGIVLGQEHSAPLAYISGTIGVLVGADILRMKDIRRMGPPIASIGGAGTFDGIFLTGILAVLLA
jgi:uncharacterized membrane protein